MISPFIRSQFLQSVREMPVDVLPPFLLILLRAGCLCPGGRRTPLLWFVSWPFVLLRVVGARLRACLFPEFA